MRVIVLGGSGRTGKLILTEASSRGHNVTALVRTPELLSELQPQVLHIIQGSPRNKADLARAFTSETPEAVIIALASNEDGFMASVHRNLVEVIKEKGLEKNTKVVTMQAFGAGSSNKNVFWPLRMVLNHTSVAVGQRDHNAVEEVMKDSGLKWTLPRPVMLSEGGLEAVKDCGDSGDKSGMGLMPSVSRKSVAAFLVDVAEDESGNWIGRTPVIMD